MAHTASAMCSRGYGAYMSNSEPETAALPDEAQVHAQAAVDAGAGEADEHPIGHAGPGGVLGRAVKADLHPRSKHPTQVSWWRASPTVLAETQSARQHAIQQAGAAQRSPVRHWNYRHSVASPAPPQQLPC